MSENPEVIRDSTITQIITAGGVVAGWTALAHPDSPHVVVAHEIHAGAPSPQVAGELAAIRAKTETQLTGLIPWMPEILEVEDDESITY